MIVAGNDKVGAALSVMVTVWIALPVSSATSVALQVIGCIPTVKGPVLSGVGINTPLTRSLAVAVPRVTAVFVPVASRVISAGGVTVGAVVSTTIILKLPEVVWLLLSVALQLTAVVPSAKVLPVTGVQLGIITPSAVSLALAV